MTSGRQKCASCLLAVLVGCGSAGSDQPAVTCVGAQSQPLVNGDTQESYLGLAESQQRAVVRIIDRTGGSAALCSGIFVTPEWLVTAAHCLEIPNLGIAIEAGSEGPSALVPVVDSVANPDRDIALVRAGLSSRD